MEELQALSTELKIHGANIRASKNRVGQEIIEIGRELSEAKEKCKKNGEKWLVFLEKECDFSETSANDYIRIYKEFGNRHHGGELGKRALLFLSTLTDEQKEQAQELTGKPVEKLETNKEVNELKEKLKVEEKKRLEAERDKFSAEKKVKELINNPIEKIPSEVKTELELKQLDIKNLGETVKRLESTITNLEEELEIIKFKDVDKNNLEKLEKEKKILQTKAEINSLLLVANINQFLKENAVSALLQGSLIKAPIEIKDQIKEQIHYLEQFCQKIRTACIATFK